jgi:hypothetical protein
MTTNRLNFESKGHRYYLDGKPLTGVTTIIGILDKPALIQWSANQAVDFIEDKLESGLGLTGFDLDEARKAWTRKRDKAGDIGSLCHSWIEDFVKYDIVHKNIDNINK